MKLTKESVRCLNLVLRFFSLHRLLGKLWHSHGVDASYSSRSLSFRVARHLKLSKINARPPAFSVEVSDRAIEERRGTFNRRCRRSISRCRKIIASQRTTQGKEGTSSDGTSRFGVRQMTLNARFAADGFVVLDLSILVRLCAGVPFYSFFLKPFKILGSRVELAGR